MSEITPGFIAKLRALLACIETPLPWKSKPAEYESKRYGAEVISGAFITPFTLEFGDEFMGLHDGDAALLTEAANALPSLMDEVERLREALSDILLLIEEHGERSVIRGHATRIMVARKALKGGEI